MLNLRQRLPYIEFKQIYDFCIISRRNEISRWNIYSAFTYIFCRKKESFYYYNGNLHAVIYKSKINLCKSGLLSAFLQFRNFFIFVIIFNCAHYPPADAQSQRCFWNSQTAKKQIPQVGLFFFVPHHRLLRRRVTTMMQMWRSENHRVCAYPNSVLVAETKQARSSNTWICIHGIYER